jgi:rare lipoprotein A (peptidoglycan hydrolase)
MVELVPISGPSLAPAIATMRYVIAVGIAAAVLLEVNSGDPVSAVPRVTLPVEHGLASFYGRAFDGKRTASGILFDMGAMHAAHPALPFGTVLRVTNRDNGRSTEVTVVDRGPAKRIRERGVVIDLSEAAARELDFIERGRAPVSIEVVSLPDAQLIEISPSGR